MIVGARYEAEATRRRGNMGCPRAVCCACVGGDVSSKVRGVGGGVGRFGSTRGYIRLGSRHLVKVRNLCRFARAAAGREIGNLVFGLGGFFN